MNPTTGFFDLGLDIRGRVFLGSATDLPDDDDALGSRVGVEQFEHVDEVRAVDRVTADAHRGGLTETERGQLMHRFVGECARA